MVNRIAESREGCALQMDTFADLIRISAKELEDSMLPTNAVEKDHGESENGTACGF